jgi:hypothetical protein
VNLRETLRNHNRPGPCPSNEQTRTSATIHVGYLPEQDNKKALDSEERHALLESLRSSIVSFEISLGGATETGRRREHVSPSTSIATALLAAASLEIMSKCRR